MRLPFVAEAADELVKTAAWYEARRRGYGARLTEQVMRAVDRAAEYPQSGSPVRTWTRSGTSGASWSGCFPTRS